MKKEDYDFNKAPIGTKITLKDGDVLVKDGDVQYENSSTVLYISDISKDKIIRIEEPKYNLVYNECLDNKEIRYIKEIIRPFKNRVMYIVKRTNKSTALEYISIAVYGCFFINLPFFENGTMYKNMETNRHYTLEDLSIK